MALAVTHSTTVVVADDGTSPVGTDEWNAAHTLTGAASIAQGGTNATDAAGALSSLGAVATSRQVISGNGLTGGGDLSADRTLAVGAGTGITVSADAIAVDSTVVGLTGKQCVPVPAAAMTASTTNGAATGSVEATTNKNMFVTFDFDTTTSESVQFSMAMPDSWNEGTITFRPVWSHGATVTNFGTVFELSAVAVSDNETGDVAFGTGQTSTDTGGTTDKIYIGPESSAITVAGSPATGDFVMFRVARLPANGSDTLAVDARLHGIKLFITTNAGNDV